MEIIGKRVIWIKYLLLILTLCFIGVDIWLFCSLFLGNKPDTLLYVMAFVVLAILLLLLTFTILSFIKKKNAICIDNDKLIIRNYKELVIDFKNIKDIKYRSNYGGGRLFNNEYNSGTIFIELDNKEIKVNNIKSVKNVCSVLRNKILNTK